MKYMWMLLFMVLPFVAIAYVGWHVWVLVPLPRVWRAVIVGMGLSAFLLTFLNFSHAIDKLPLWLAQLSYDISNSTVFILLYLVIIFLALDAGRLLVRLFRPEWLQQDWLHHNFYTTAALTVGVFVVFLWGNIHYHNKAREELHLTTDKPLVKPLRLVLMSDLHLGYHNTRKELARWVDLVNGEHPDIILIAGDIIDMSMRPLIEEDMAEEMRRLDAPVYACLGNHEYYSGEPMARQFYHEAGIHLLQDTCEVVGDLLIIGRDDRSNVHRKALGKLLAEAQTVSLQAGQSSLHSLLSSKYTIVLDHQPYFLEQAERAGIDFQFSGHTHRGQVWPISWITDRLYECSYGSWQRGTTRYYVSSGMGLWGGKFRIGTQSEYVVAELSGGKQ